MQNESCDIGLVEILQSLNTQSPYFFLVTKLETFPQYYHLWYLLWYLLLHLHLYVPILLLSTAEHPDVLGDIPTDEHSHREVPGSVPPTGVQGTQGQALPKGPHDDLYHPLNPSISHPQHPKVFWNRIYHQQHHQWWKHHPRRNNKLWNNNFEVGKVLCNYIKLA